MIKVGVIGYGYWGPNIVRNLSDIKEARVEAICDSNPVVYKKLEEKYPHIKLTTDYRKIIDDDTIDAVAIITPVSTHFSLAKEALLAGKHIFVEKPFTATVKEARELIALAKKKKRIIMVDHTFIFTGAVQKIKDLVDDGSLGDLIYFDSTRVSLGLFQHDVNVIWDLAPHDLAIIDYLIKNKPLAVSAHGIDHLGRGKENLAYITIHYEKNLLVHINVNWLSPVKVRMTLIGGSKKMLVWDDLQTDEKIKVYDRGAEVKNKEGVYKLLVDYRSGDMWSPRVDQTEALKRELIYFAECIEKKQQPVNDGVSGLRIVKLLELADKSLKSGGRLIKIK
jgi:predicted dehydrogenase